MVSATDKPAGILCQDCGRKRGPHPLCDECVERRSAAIHATFLASREKRLAAAVRKAAAQGVG